MRYGMTRQSSSLLHLFLCLPESVASRRAARISLLHFSSPGAASIAFVMDLRGNNPEAGPLSGEIQVKNPSTEGGFANTVSSMKWDQPAND